MSLTIKDQMHNQIMINQHLLSFEDSDSSKSDGQQINQNMALKKISHKLQDQNALYSHQQMIKKRRQVLRQISISPSNKISKTSNDKVKSLKSRHQQRSSQKNYDTIVDLKSKLAQVLKESQEKSKKLKEVQNSLNSATQNIQILRQTLHQKENQVNLKEKQISRLQYQNFQLKEEYHNRIKELQQQLNINDINKKTESSCKPALSKIQNNTLNQLKIQVQLKSQEINELRKNEQKGKKIVGKNKKLKKDVERLLMLVQKCAQKQNFSKNKHKKTDEKRNVQKSAKKRCISLGQQVLIRNKYSRSDYNSVKCSESTKNQQFEKSVTSINDKKPLSQSSSCLITEVQKFLRKWHVAQNNHKFVQSLVDLIHQFTQQCIDQHKVKIESHYKSLKKQMLRKANQSLNFQQIMRERQFKIKQNTTLNDQNQKLKVLKTQPQFNVKERTLSSDNLSILVPASNKMQYDYKNSKLLSVSLLEDKSIRKEDISYNNLEQSIRLHQKMSKNQIVQKIGSNDKIEQKIDSIFTQTNMRKQPHRKTKTQRSNFSHKHRNSYDKKSTKNQYKNLGLTIKNFKII